MISSIDLNHNNISDLKTNSTSSRSSGKDFHQIQLLKECLICSLNKSNFSTIICFAFENSIHFQQQQQHNINNIISQLSKILKLNRIQEIAIACLLKNCNKEEIKQAAQYTLEQKLTELTQSAADQSSFGELGMYINIMKK